MSWPMLSKLAALVLSAGLDVESPAPAAAWRLPLEPYPVDDTCLAWGGTNGNFPRCGRPGKHVADDACVPNGTTVLAVAAGRLRYAGLIDDCFTNWGWVIVVEHELPDGPHVCSVYGHCEPLAGIAAGQDIAFAQPIASVANPCVPHIHFGIYNRPFDATEGTYPYWLVGYLPDARQCESFPAAFPGDWVDPVQFVQERVALTGRPWSQVKRLYR